MKATAHSKRRICFVTGTRAEFGLMRTVLRAIERHPKLHLQIVATGMHLDRKHGRSIAEIGADAVVNWPANSGRRPAINAVNTGRAIAELARAFERLGTDMVLVVGDRVEAFAAAAAGHLSHIPVAHIHGGDRALGQIDDSLRHAITKLAHVHFPATPQSAKRIQRLGEQSWRIHCVGSPGIDGIRQCAATWTQVRREFPKLRRRDFALLVLHPVSASASTEKRNAEIVLGAIQRSGLKQVVIIYPNNDPGSSGIIDCWEKHRRDEGLIIRRDLPRPIFLGLLRNAAVLVGNSSSGIIEAEAFGTRVIDIGPRQTGRQRGPNVAHCDYSPAAISRQLKKLAIRATRRRRIYGGQGAGAAIARILSRLKIDSRLIKKLIRY